MPLRPMQALCAQPAGPLRPAQCFDSACVRCIGSDDFNCPKCDAARQWCTACPGYYGVTKDCKKWWAWVLECQKDGNVAVGPSLHCLGKRPLLRWACMPEAIFHACGRGSLPAPHPGAQVPLPAFAPCRSKDPLCSSCPNNASKCQSCGSASPTQGTYKDAQGRCRPCPEGCYFCDGKGVCKQCADGYGFKGKACAK